MGLLHDLIWGKPVNGGSEGGGGSSDFSTAEVTFINVANGQGFSYPYVVYVGDNDTDNLIFYTSNRITIVPNGSKTVKLPIPVNGALILGVEGIGSLDTSYLPTVTGDITLDMENFQFVITGSGTITASGESPSRFL